MISWSAGSSLSKSSITTLTGGPGAAIVFTTASRSGEPTPVCGLTAPGRSGPADARGSPALSAADKNLQTSARPPDPALRQKTGPDSRATRAQWASSTDLPAPAGGQTSP